MFQEVYISGQNISGNASESYSVYVMSANFTRPSGIGTPRIVQTKRVFGYLLMSIIVIISGKYRNNEPGGKLSEMECLSSMSHQYSIYWLIIREDFTIYVDLTNTLKSWLNNNRKSINVVYQANERTGSPLFQCLTFSSRKKLSLQMQLSRR